MRVMGPKALDARGFLIGAFVLPVIVGITLLATGSSNDAGSILTVYYVLFFASLLYSAKQ